VKEVKIKVLKWVLILSGLFQIGYYGISHLFFPLWYLRSVGIDVAAANLEETFLFLHEIGVLAIGIGVATILAANNPIKNIAIIVTLYVISVGSMLTSSYHILFKGTAGGEWMTVAIIAAQVIIVTLLYPWEDLRSIHSEV
jgi:hypothetical protein